VYPRTDPDVHYRMITRYEDVRFVLEHPELFSSTGSAISEINVRLPPLDADPPEHPDFRRILNPLMSRSALLRFEPEMRRIARETIEGFIDDGEVEFISGFAVPYTAGVLSRVIFDEDDADKIAETVGVVSLCATDPSPESFFQLAMCAGGYIAKREAQPGDADDILTALAAGTITGRPLTQEEHLGVVTVLFLAGLDTTRGAIGNIAAHLARTPGLEDRLRDPRWIRRDMDEFLRYESPVAIMGRTVLAEVELAGERFVPGDRIIVNFGSANRDDRQFPNADQLDFDAARSGNMAFGLGIHRCLGSNLARLQIEFGYDELLKRITRLRLTGEDTDVHYETGMVHGPAALPLAFERI
jgi:cytochrome P450